MAQGFSNGEAGSFDETRRFLDAALQRHILDARTYDAMLDLLAVHRRSVSVIADDVPVPPMPAPPAMAAGALPATDAVQGEPWTAAQTHATPDGPSGLERRLRAARDLIASDIAVHGLTYLGVLLLFAGVFGFVLFSFGSVRVGLRPVAEIAAPGVLLASARFLRRRGAPFVATALGLLGGVLLPIFLFASFVDGVPLPPDPAGGALIASLMTVSLATAAGYAWYATRVPDASVRFLVVPALWLAVWAAALLAARLPDGGYSLRHWSSAQLSIVAASIAAAAVFVRLRPSARLAVSTRKTILPVIGVAYLLTVSLAAGEGWPSGPLVFAGLALLIVIESTSMPVGVAQVIEPVVLAAVIVPFAPTLGAPWTGVVGAAAFVGLVERLHLRRPGGTGAIAALLGVASGLAVCAMEPWPAVAGFGVVSGWAHVRRMRLPRGVPSPSEFFSTYAAILPAAAAVALVLAVSDGAAAVILGVVVVSISAATRVWRSHDRFLGWWVGAAAAAVTMGSASPTVRPAAAAAAAGLAALSFFLAPAAAWVVGWGAPVALGWAMSSAAEAAGVGASDTVLALAVLGFGLVLVSGLESRSMREVGSHAGGAGLALSAIALALPVTGSGWERMGVLAAWIGATVAATVWSETRGTGPVGALSGWLERLGRPRISAIVRVAPVIGAAAGLPFLAIQLGDRTGVTALRRSWNGVPVAVTGVAEALAARRIAAARPRPTSFGSRSGVGQTAAAAAFFTTLVGIAVAAPDPWPTIQALLAPVAVTLALGGTLRRPAMTWTAWLSSAAFVVLLSDRAGVAPQDLWLATFAWGATTLVGGLALDDVRAGRRVAGETVRTNWLRPPVALGALALPASLAFAFRGSPDWYGAWSLAAAAAYLVVALQLRAGMLAGVAAALATEAYVVFLPTSPIDEPLMFVPWSAALVAIAVALSRRSRVADPWARWDLGLLVVAHGVAVIALTRAVALDDIAPVWAAFGGLSIVVALALRRLEWALAGAALLVIAAADAGPGWLALTLATASLASGLAASRSSSPLRWGLQVSSAALAASSWEQFIEWTTWSTARAVVVTLVVAVGLLIVPSVALKLERLAVDWGLTLTGLGIAGAASAAAFARLPASAMSGRNADVVAAVATAALSAAIGISASRLRARWQRETSAILAVAATLMLGAAMEPSIALGSAVSASAGLVAVLLWIALWRARPGSPWLGAVGMVAVSADGVALALAGALLPRADMLEAALVLTGLECAVGGLALRRPHLVTPAPAFVGVAWLVFAADAFRGQIHWFTLPSGVALLAMVSIERRAARILKRSPMGDELLLIEYLGMFFVVAMALFETISIGPVRGLIAVAGGVALASWGALTLVRRRVWFGAAVVGAAVSLMLIGPIARLVPELHGSALWALLAVAGIVLIVAATVLERGREKVAAFGRRLDLLMEGWE